jgi:hypothetical protein
MPVEPHAVEAADAMEAAAGAMEAAAGVESEDSGRGNGAGGSALVPRTQRSASSAVRCRAGAHYLASVRMLGPGSAPRRFTPQRVRDTRATSEHRYNLPPSLRQKFSLAPWREERPMPAEPHAVEAAEAMEAAAGVESGGERPREWSGRQRTRAPDAAQRLFGGALQSRGPLPRIHPSQAPGSRLCAAAFHAAARPGHESCALGEAVAPGLLTHRYNLPASLR